MSGFALLWGKILESSIWVKETKETRLVWITLMAMKDSQGVIQSSVIGLADRAKVSLPECKTALKVLLSPDPDDTSGVDEGKRIREVPGGWQVVNHDLYRFSTAAKREFWREQKRMQRQQGGGPEEDGFTCLEWDAKEQPKPVIVTAPPKEREWNPTPEQIRLGALFRRRPDTKWSLGEIKAWKAIGGVSEQDLQWLERMYQAKVPESKDYRRRDLSTLLNNFTGEVDRARNFKEPNCL